MREVGEKPVKRKKKEKKYVSAAKKGFHGMLKFLGNAGEAYYDRYEELKAKRAKK